MSSPPYTHSPIALSPPHPLSIQLPALSINTMASKKRPNVDTTSGGPGLKRRKASTMSVPSVTSAHPLRQTSFPPDESQAATPFSARSPSIDDNASLVSGSQVSASNLVAQAPTKKKRGRKPKSQAQRDRTPSAAGGTAATVLSGASGPSGRRKHGRQEEEEDEEEDDAGGAALTKRGARTKEEKEAENRAKAMLVQSFRGSQEERFTFYRAARFMDAPVRRLVNSTASQSVTPNPLLSVRVIARMFAGDLIESAVRVQREWKANADEKQAEDHNETLPPVVGFDTDTGTQRAALRPEHLIEAYRRYKTSQAGGAPGALALWHAQQHSGAERFGLRTRGKRIFR